jgi:hypothetical protein
VLHGLIGGSDPSGALGVYLDVFGLSFEVDAVVAGVLLGDCDKARVWSRKAWD